MARLQPVPPPSSPDDALPGIVVPGPAGWAAVAELFLDGIENRNTRAAYRTDLRQWASWCSSRSVDPLAATRADLIQYRAHLEETQARAAATVARKLSAISGAYREALAEEVIVRSPLAAVRRPKVPKRSRRRGLDHEQLLEYLAAASTAEAGPKARALATVLAHNGLRISEVCSCDVADLQRVGRHRILVVTRKGGAEVEVPLDDLTAEAVDAYLAGRRTGPLLLGRGETGRLSRKAAARIVARIGQLAGLEAEVTPHLLRHSFVTLSLDAGVPIHLVQEGAGHADPKTTQIYNDSIGRLDRSPTHRLVDFLYGRTRPEDADPQGQLF